ncbi:type II toxin-antitoxin system VapC family toxin [Roseobacter denitrificans]|uniref:Ribonuclease VapC n=2 Tax=Roseobacter denitrificans TaxID=2434 RepID=Q07GS1_ROSDO|nr:type II toxin-antitoxin system VapC family toxin [Roseobacter denitrificans]ABI93328.1 conserved domain protein [Roseobacter denitrificans OCh 114]
MTLYMLDTDICSYLMREHPAAVLRAMEKQVEAGEDICISVITYSELRLGAARSQARAKYDGLIDALSDRLDFIADWSTKEADRFADVQSHLLGQGAPIGANDTMIAAHALSLGAVLVTNNQRHFSKIEELVLENWLDQSD